MTKEEDSSQSEMKSPDSPGRSPQEFLCYSGIVIAYPGCNLRVYKFISALAGMSFVARSSDRQVSFTKLIVSTALTYL